MLEAPIRYAVLHLGASSTSISIIDYKSINDFKVIEHAHQAVTFGEELFQYHRLSFKTIEEICRILKGYRQLMLDYGVEDYTLFATATVREAENRRSIIDQIFIHTGLDVTVIDMSKEIYFKFFRLYYRMLRKGIAKSEDAALFLDITSGGVGITVWQAGRVVFQENVHIGFLRVMEIFTRNQRSAATFSEAIGEYFHSMLSPVQEEVSQFNVRYLILSGDEAVYVANMMGMACAEKGTLFFTIDEFLSFFNSFHGVTATKLVNRYGIPEFRANVLMPTIVLYNEILKMITPQEIVVSTTSFVDGVSLYYGAEKEDAPYLHQLREQNVELARSIARRYHTDEEHGRTMEGFMVQFCEALRPVGVSSRSMYLGRIAAILNDIGKYVSLRNNGIHAYHLIKGTDIFGLSDEEKDIVANVVYYHFQGMPSDDDPNFAELEEVPKIRVTKLVAILRLLRALDASHKQKIQKISVERDKNKLVVWASTMEDISLETWTFEKESGFFTDVFGLEVQLRIRGRD